MDASRERLRRAVEDAERLYRTRMHAPDGPTIADDNRIDGILTLDLPDALGAYDRLAAQLQVALGWLGLIEETARWYAGERAMTWNCPKCKVVCWLPYCQACGRDKPQKSPKPPTGGADG